MKQEFRYQFRLYNVTMMMKQFVIVGLFVWLAACTEQSVVPEPSSTSQLSYLEITKIPVPTATPALTLSIEGSSTNTLTPTMTDEPTSTPKPTKTPTMTSTSTPTYTPTPSATPTEEVTRAPVDQLQLLRQLLVPDEQCQLPCWWGLNVGIDSKEIVDQFMKEQQVERYVEYSDYPQYSYARFRYDTDSVSDIKLTFFSNPILRKIHISSTLPYEANTQAQFYQDWFIYYTPGKFIEYVGQPDHVILVNLTPGAELVLLYESLGLEVRYVIKKVQILDPDSGQVRICLLEEQIMNVDIYILDTGHMDPNDDGLATYHPERYEGENWETRTGTSLEHFYEAVKSEMPCFVY